MDAKDKGQSGTRGNNQGQWSSSTMKYQSMLNSMAGVQTREKSRSMFNNLWTESWRAKLKL